MPALNKRRAKSRKPVRRTPPPRWLRPVLRGSVALVAITCSAGLPSCASRALSRATRI